MIRVLVILVLATFAVKAEEIVFQKGLAVRAPERPRRAPFHTDAVEALIVKGEWKTPAEGDSLLGTATNEIWRTAIAGADGVFTNRELQGGYLNCAWKSDQDDILILSASGQDVVYVNGEPHAGDPYFNGMLRIPVQVRAGANDFLFRVSRGRVSAKLSTPARPVAFYLGDSTTPDIVRGERAPLWAAVVIVNSSTNELHGLVLSATPVDGKATQNPVPVIPPLGVRKVGFRFDPRWTDATNRLELKLALKSAKHDLLDSASIWLDLKKETDHYKVTFISETDGSVQYYAVAPPNPSPGQPVPKALFLSLHGASVEATSQAAAYQSKPWGAVVAATNRRYYGFDWEDWGRRDALEVLENARARFQPDPHAIYLTGHSMGGHGTWYMGVTYPDKFAAIAPSAGWISWFSYGGAERATNANPLREMVERASNPVDTLALISNTLHYGVYVLHGDADDNVPVSEARTMRRHLEKFHHDFMYHEQPGAGHWWGNQCVDWPPIFDFFARHRRPDDDSVLDINFTTMNPGVSATSHWLTIWEQTHPLERSTVTAHYDPIRHAFEIATTNISRLVLDLTQIAPGKPVEISLDDQELESVHAEKIWLENNSGHWTLSAPPPSAWKSPTRSGPLREAFGNRMMFVYATHGAASENQWAIARARFDAESWWYRGNGSVDVIPDSEFDPFKEPDRGVVIYGNADNNSAWRELLRDCPVQVARGSIRVGSHSFSGDSLACIFCRPRRGSVRASVAVIGGSGLTGMKLTDHVPYLGAGIAYPDCAVFGPEILSEEFAGIKAAGFFGNDWSVNAGDFAWGE
jgi:dienelactone hydrolase